jgi:U2 small nuclear ribonucleoprotein A'
MSITVELIQRSQQYLNALNEREICLRGLNISVIENLGATLVILKQDQFEVINLTNNQIKKLEDSAHLRSLGTFLLSNNEISAIVPTFGSNYPRLENLVLTNNKVTFKKISNLSQLDNLSNCKFLKRLSLLNNPVTKVQNYRLYAIFKIPSLCVLDFQKVKDKERVLAKQIFETRESFEEVLEKRRKIDEKKWVKKPVDLPCYLKTQEENLNNVKLM